MELSPQQILCQFLKEEGFPIVETDEHGEVVFRCEGKYYIIHLHPDFPTRCALALPAFWGLEDPEEAARALTAANEVNLRCYGATVVCLSHTVTAFADMFVANPAADLKALFYPALKALQAAVHTFVSLMLTGESAGSHANGSSSVPAPGGNGAELGGYL